MNARATAVLEALPLAVLMAEPAGRVTYANAAAHALFSPDVERLSPAERARCWVTRHVDGSPIVGEDLPTMRAIRGERLRNFEYRITHADGTERRVLVSSEPIEGPDGRPLGAACVFEDVTERRRSEQRLADALREQTASAREKARLSEALAARADRLRRITELNRLISASLDTGEVLREIGRAAADLARAAVVGFWILDPEQDVLQLSGGWGDEYLRGVPARTLRCDESLVGWVARHRQPLNVPDVLADGRFGFREWAARNGLRGFLGIPILLGDTLIGVLGMCGVQPFDLDADEELFESFVAQAAVAVRNATLYTQAEERRRRAERLAESGRALAEIRDVGELCRHIVGSTRDLLGANLALLYRLDPASPELTVVAQAGAAQDLALLGGGLTLPKGSGVAGAAIDARRTIVSANFLTDPAIVYPPAIRRRLERTDLRSAVGVPLVVKGGEMVGAVVVLDRLGRRFDDDAVRTVRAFSDQAALALDNARLYHQAEQRQREAEQAARAKEEFVAVLSHELRTPLGAMLGWVSMLRTRRLDAARAAQGLETLERNVRVLGRLIEDLLDVSRIVAGKMQLETQPVDLAPVITAAVEKLRPEADANGITIEITAAPGAGLVLGDPVRLEQILTNLVSNAVKFTPAGGRVSVDLARVDNEVRIVVRDTGEGIDPQVLPYVFDRFRQVDGTRTRRQGGLGLGLAIVRSLTQLHGGTVTAESPGRGAGATFTAALPVLAVLPADPRRALPADARVRRSDEPVPPLDGLRVLVVEDHRDSREMIGTILQEGGATVELTGSADEGLQRLQQWQADVLISDLGMPGLDGFDLIRAVRAQEDAGEASQRLVAVALSAHASDEDRARALAAGFQNYAAKPIDPTDLIALVGRTARRPAGDLC